MSLLLVTALTGCKAMNDAMNEANEKAAKKELGELKGATPIGAFVEKDFRTTLKKKGLERTVEKFEGYVANLSGKITTFDELMTPVGRAMYVEFNKRYKFKCTFDVASTGKIATWEKGQTQAFRIKINHVTKKYAQGMCTLD
jgi:hypothetical protein